MRAVEVFDLRAPIEDALERATGLRARLNGGTAIGPARGENWRAEVAWRAGQTDLLQSSLTRAIFFSAMTTATAFGSLWLSSHPGTSSMGKLLALSLVTTLAAAVLFQPALMGRPRNVRE